MPRGAHRRGLAVALCLPLLAIAPGLSCGGRGDNPGGPLHGPSRTAATPRPGVSPAEPAEADRAEIKRRYYVAVYPYVYTEDRAHPYNLAATLYIRNTDPDAPLFLTSVRLHDAAGKAVRDDLNAPVRLDPLAAAEFFVKESETAVGASASFVVTCASPAGASEPQVETVMIGTLSNQGIAFTSQARPVPLGAREAAGAQR
jgi:hypothetical protein